MNPIRLLIADDHTLFRSGLRALFAMIEGLALVGEAASGREAIDQAVALQPDVILMDIQMPDVNGIEATREIVRINPDCGIIMLTMFEDGDSVFAALRAGARGYVLKGADQDEMVQVIQAVAGGGAYFGADIAQKLSAFFSQIRPGSAAFPELTDREVEILDLIAQGLNNPEIARRLIISPKTVRNHVSNILNKLQVADRAAAIVKAREAGFGGEGS